MNHTAFLSALFPRETLSQIPPIPTGQRTALAMLKLRFTTLLHLAYPESGYRVADGLNIGRGWFPLLRVLLEHICPYVRTIGGSILRAAIIPPIRWPGRQSAV